MSPAHEHDADRRTVVELQHLLHLLGDYAGAIDGSFGPATEEAVRTLQRRLEQAPSGEVAPALIAAAREQAARACGDAFVRAAEAAEAAADFYAQIAALRRGEVEAARTHKTPRPTSLAEEEVAASLLAAARSRLDAAAHWRRAALLADAGAVRLARARDAQARAREAARAAGPWFMSAAAGHAAAGDRLQGSRALDGAARAAAALAEATMPDPT